MFQSKLNHLLLQKSADIGRLITQRELAQATRLPEPTITLWMKPERPMSQVKAHVVAALIAYFNCGIEDLLEVAGDKNADPENKAALTRVVA